VSLALLSTLVPVETVFTAGKAIDLVQERLDRMSLQDGSKSMSIGIALLDDDHEIIMCLTIRLQNCLEGREDTASLAAICERLIAYMEFHQAREEKVMEACAYPNLEMHREDHTRFIHDVYDFMDRFAAQRDAAILREFLSYLQEWIEQHVLAQDTGMRVFITNNARAHAVAEAFGRIDPR
jgi:hemerythrin-like metal-binding protein